MGRVIVLGGGIAGLAAGHRLVEAGHEVRLLEAAPRLGGLGSTFTYRGRDHERFYHTLSAADTTLLQLVEDAGLGRQDEWITTSMGMIVEDRHYDFTTPLDLLRFDPLTFAQRLRLGVGGKSLRLLGRKRDLDGMSAEQWMRPIFGSAVWEKVWRPMFSMKFGGASVPALYLYERLARESNVAERAYPRIGYQGYADGIAASIRRQGGEVRVSTPVRTVEQRGGRAVVTTDDEELDADLALSTLPMPQLESLAKGTLAEALHLPAIEYMGVVNVLFFTRCALTGHYWAPVIDSTAEFSGTIEISTLTGTEQFHGYHAAYVMRYVDRTSALFQESDDAIAERWTEQFIRLYDLTPDDVAEVFVFRTPFVEPVWPIGYGRLKPPPRIGDTPLFMATTAQAYPRVTSWDAATETAERTVRAMEAVLDRVG
jgi:protoporphyrinogen oxidase